MNAFEEEKKLRATVLDALDQIASDFYEVVDDCGADQEDFFEFFYSPEKGFGVKFYGYVVWDSWNNTYWDDAKDCIDLSVVELDIRRGVATVLSTMNVISGLACAGKFNMKYLGTGDLNEKS